MLKGDDDDDEREEERERGEKGNALVCSTRCRVDATLARPQYI